MKKRIQKQQGFTLVELAMVFFVIGALVVGVIKGQEWFTNVKLYQLQSEFEEFEGLVNMYYIKTGKTPIGHPNELFWKALRTEGLIEGDPSDGSSPKDSFGNLWVARGGGSGSSLFRNSTYLCATAVKDVYAKAIDLKLDDGKGTTGRIKSFRYIGANNGPNGAQNIYFSNWRKSSLIDYPENQMEMVVCKRMVRINIF